MEFMDQADRDISDCYPVEFNQVLKNAYTAYLRDRSTIPVELLQHEFFAIVDVLKRVDRIQTQSKIGT